MKQSVVAMFIGLFCFNAMAHDAKAIFNALGVEAMVWNPNGTAGYMLTMIKTAGAITCAETMTIIPEDEPVFNCDLKGDATSQEYEAVYGALVVPETVLNPGMGGKSRLEKAVGGLSCLRELLATHEAQPSYFCELN